MGGPRSPIDGDRLQSSSHPSQRSSTMLGLERPCTKMEGLIYGQVKRRYDVRGAMSDDVGEIEKRT